MAKKLTWEEIEKQHDKEWVELIDYDWPDEEPLPRTGVVRVHAHARKEFDELILQDPPAEAAIIFVGERELPPNTIISANLHRWQFEAR